MSISTLTYIYVGYNSFVGTIPNSISASLQFFSTNRNRLSGVIYLVECTLVKGWLLRFVGTIVGILAIWNLQNVYLKGFLAMIQLYLSHQNPVSGSFRGDVLQRVGEADIRTANNFYKAVDLNAGKSTPVIVVRDGKELTKQIDIRRWSRAW